MKKKKKGEGKWYRYEQGGNFYPAEYPFEADEKEYWYKERCEENLKDGDIYIYRVRYLLGEKMYQIGEIIYHEPEYRYEHKIFMKMNEQTEVAKINFFVSDTVDTAVGDDLLDILEKKLEEFDNKSDFDRKIHDMRLLNLVDKKTKQDVPLTREELRFLYEIDNKMEYINSNKDYRIGKIIARRKSIAEDMNCIYDFKRISEYLDDLNLDVVKDPAGLQLPKITGNLSLHGLEKTAGLKLPKIVKGDLTVAGVTESSHVVFPKIVEGSLSIFDVIIPYDIPPLSELEINYSTPKQVVSANQLTLPEIVKEDLFINVTIKNFEYLKLPQVEGILSIACSEKATGLILPEVIYCLSLNHLISAEGVLFPEKIDSCLQLNSLKYTNGLILPKNVKGKIKCKINIPDSCFMEDDDYKKYRQNLLYRLKATKEICKEYNVSKDEIAFSINECKKNKGRIKVLKANVNLNDIFDKGDFDALPEIIIGDINLEEKTYLNNFTFKSNVVGNLNFSGLVSAKKVILSGGVRGSVSLSNLTEVKELVLPRIIEKDLIMNKLKEINGNVIFSKMICGTVDLSSLVSVESVNFSEIIQGDLKLPSLEYIDNSSLPKLVGKSFIMHNLKKTTSLVLPKIVGEGVFLSNLSEFDYLELPQEINGTLSLEGLKSADGLIFPEVVTKSVYLNNLKSLTNSKLPRVVGCHLNMENLLEINNSQLPSIINGDLLLRRLKTTDKLSLPDIVNGCVSLGSLTNVDTLILSKYIGGTLNLCSLENAREVVFPEVINEETWLGNFDKENVKLPASVKEKILTKNVPYDCYIADDDYKKYRQTMIDRAKATKEICKEYNVSKDEIAFSINECKKNKGRIKVLKANVNLNDVFDKGDFDALPEIIIGDVNLEEKTYLNNFTFKSNVVGNLNFSGLVSAKRITLLGGVRGSIDLSNLTKIEELELSPIIEKDLIMSKIKEINSNVIFSKGVGGTLDLSSLVAVENVSFPENVLGALKLPELECIDNISFPKVVGKSLIMTKLKTANNLTLPKLVGECVILSSLNEFSHLELPQTINGTLYLEGLEYVDNLTFPEVVTRSLCLNNLKSLTNSKLPRIVGRHLNMENLVEINNSQLPSIINGDLLLQRLKTTDRLSLPDIINGDVSLGSLTDVDTLILSKYIGGALNLRGLANSREVVFPEMINEETWLGNFDKENVKLPINLKKKILTKNVPYDCFIDNDEFREYRSAKIEELNVIRPLNKVSKIKKLIRRLTNHS